MERTIRPQDGWVAVAEGPGVASIETPDRGLRWFPSFDPPAAGTPGFTLTALELTPMSLDSGETLYLSGAGSVYVAAENPVT